MAMDYDTYMAGVTTKTGKTPYEIRDIMVEKGFTAKGTSASMVKEYLAKEYGIGHGHAMGIWKILSPLVEK